MEAVPEEKKTYVIKRPDDLAEIIRAGRAGDSSPLEIFLNEPLPVIAGAITEFFSHGPVALVGHAVRIVQGALKGKLFQQLAKEIRDLRGNGKIEENFGEKKYGFQSWVELLTVIDEEAPDADRLEALKAMFFSINKINATDGEQILGYQLFQIAKRLTSNELLVLKAIYELVRAKSFGNQHMSFTQWAETVSKHLGHNLTSLIEHADKALVENQLLSERTYQDRSGIQGATQHGRLTDLGTRFCGNIERYRMDTAEDSTA